MKLYRLTACTVETSVASLDGIVDLIGTGLIVDFPEPGVCVSKTDGVSLSMRE